MILKDKQKKSVYRWESKFFNIDKSCIKIKYAQNVVNYIWEQCGLKYPPKVYKLDKKNKKCMAKADRLSVILSDNLPTFIILHELAHSMTSDIEGNTNGHGAYFMGVYVKLLAKFLNLDLDNLISSAKMSGLRVDEKVSFLTFS